MQSCAVRFVEDALPPLPLSCVNGPAQRTQPTRMRILGQLLGAGIHPKLSAATAHACVAEIAAEADELEKAVEASQLTSEKVNVFARVRTALGKVLHAELSNLKRAYKIEGFSEAEIHTVIPDRPSKTKKGGNDGGSCSAECSAVGHKRIEGKTRLWKQGRGFLLGCSDCELWSR